MLPIHRQVYLLAYLQEGWAKMRWVFYELLTVPWTCPWRPNQPKSYFHKKSLPQDLIRKILALAAAISLLFQQRRWAATFTHEPRRQEAYYQTKQQVWLENSKLFDHFRLNLNGVIFFSLYLSWNHLVFVLLPIFQPLTSPTGKKHTTKPSSRFDLKTQCYLIILGWIWMGQYFFKEFKLRPSGFCPSANLSTSPKPRWQEAYYQTKEQVWLEKLKLLVYSRLNLNGVLMESLNQNRWWQHPYYLFW